MAGDQAKAELWKDAALDVLKLLYCCYTAGGDRDEPCSPEKVDLVDGWEHNGH